MCACLDVADLFAIVTRLMIDKACSWLADICQPLLSEHMNYQLSCLLS